MKVKEQAKELASLLGVSSPQEQVNPQPSTNQVVDESMEELAPEPAFEFNYKKTKAYCIKEARESIKKTARTVFRDSEFIDKSFIADKIEQDAKQLGQLYYEQLKLQAMEESNMESVRKGNISPRMYETFNAMAKTLMELDKQIADFQISIKENYAKIKFDSLDDFVPSQPSISSPSEQNLLGASNIYKNTKELNLALMEERKRRMLAAKESDFVEIKEESTEGEKND